MAAAVILSTKRLIAGLDDSKRLTPSTRERLCEVLCREPDVHVGIGVASVEEIEVLNILGATRRAMTRAVEALPARPDFLLVDGMFIRGMRVPHRKIIKGDALSASIAAASIVAKVTRDRMMLELDGRYAAYGFARHKGYGTKHHVEMLKAHGPCPAHRRGFAPVKELLGQETAREGAGLWTIS